MDSPLTRAMADVSAQAAAETECARTARTETVLAYWRGNENEFSHLHALLCMPHPFNHRTDDYKLCNAVFDGIMIAARLDELNAASRARALAILSA